MLLLRLRHFHESAGVLGSGGTAGRRHSPNGHPLQSRKRSHVAGGSMSVDEATVAALLVLRVKKLFTEKNASLSLSPSLASSFSSSSTATPFSVLETFPRTLLGSSGVKDHAKAADRVGESTVHLDDRFFISRFLISFSITCTHGTINAIY